MMCSFVLIAQLLLVLIKFVANTVVKVILLPQRVEYKVFNQLISSKTVGRYIAYDFLGETGTLGVGAYCFSSDWKKYLQNGAKQCLSELPSHLHLNLFIKSDLPKFILICSHCKLTSGTISSHFPFPLSISLFLLPFLAALAALYLTLVGQSLTDCHFRIPRQRVTFKTSDPSDI